ncbi:MAG: FAD-dependent oxidoreductase, partial [Nanoarchaeota archaeon]|nr:FAD-dependent oxidoreductase [Nanoarchaeota archaeon]
SLYDRAQEKGVDIEYLPREAIRELEPNIEAIAGFHTKQTGIIDAATYVRDLAKIVEKKEGIVLRKACIKNIIPVGDDFVLQVSQDDLEYEVQAGLVVNAAGLFADEVARRVNPEFPYVIRPLRGEFMKFNKKSRPELWMQGMNVYPVPEPIPGMFDQWGNQKAMAGVHLTPTFELGADGMAHIGNTVLLGPLGRPVESKTDYTHDRCGPEAFIKRIRLLFPQLRVEDLQEDQVGIQVKIKGYDDYIIARDPRYPNFANMFCDSPGMSGSLANGRYMVYDVLKEWHIRT